MKRITLSRPEMVEEYRDSEQFIARVEGQQFGVVKMYLGVEAEWVCYGLTPSHVIGRAPSLYELFDIMEAYLLQMEQTYGTSKT